MGLLDGNLDPQSMATMQLAAGLLSPGSFGQGLGRGLSAYQGTLGNAQEMQLRQQQIQQAIQDQKIKDISLQQQTRMFQLQTPFLEEAMRRMQGGAPAETPNTPAPGAGIGSPVPPVASAQGGQQAPQGQQSAAPQGGSMFPGVPDNVAFGMIGTGGFNKLPDIISKYNEPTDFVKTLTAAGIDPNSAIGHQLIQNNIAKSNYIAPVNARPGAILRNPNTMQPMAFNPHVPEGGTPVFDASGNVTAINPLAGATNVMAAAAAAQAQGKAQFTPFAGKDASGNPAPITSVASALAPTQPNPNVIPPDVQTQRNAESLRILLDERAKTPPGPDRDALDKEIRRTQNAALTGKPFSVSTSASAAPARGGLYAEAPLGTATTADESAKDAVHNYNEMHTFASSSAPRNIGLLQTIQQLADKTMMGPGASKLQFVNGVLNTLGITPGADQAQNYQIMKKNLNMLVGSQRMGAAGGGSDALQSLLEAANPNVAEMNGPAAKEAADELIAYNRMMMAKDKVMPSPLSVPTQKFQQAETQFTKFADPRLWQIEHAQSDAERARILSLMPRSEIPAFLEKAKAARAAGVLN